MWGGRCWRGRDRRWKVWREEKRWWCGGNGDGDGREGSFDFEVKLRCWWECGGGEVGFGMAVCDDGGRSDWVGVLGEELGLR